MSHLSVVIPVYKAENSLYELYERLNTSISTITDDFEIILVEDCGGDRSWDIILELAQKDSRVKGIQFSRNFGQHPAISAGFERASGQFVVLMDCDLQDKPEDIPILLEYLKTHNADIVYTIKLGDLGSWLNKLTSRLYHFIFSKLTKIKVPTNIGTFRLFTRKVLQSILQYGERNILYGPLMFYMGFKSVFLQVTHDQRNVGKSNYSFWKRLFMAIDSLMSYTSFPHRLFIFIGTMVLSASIFYLLTTVIRYLIFGRALPAGITLLVFIVTGSTGTILLSLGIIGNYVFRVYNEVLRRPRYLISQKININDQNFPKRS